MPRTVAANPLADVQKLPVATAKDFVEGVRVQTASNIVKTADTDLATKLIVLRFAEKLQGPKRGRQPASGTPLYILKIFPNRDAPVPTPTAGQNKAQALINRAPKIPWFMLLPLAEAGIAESKKQRSTIAKQLDSEIDSLETQLRSTKDRTEKKRLADALQTALSAEDDIDAEILRRVQRKLSGSNEPFSQFVDSVDWTAQK